ncbi:alpha/beta hydrolase [Shewanella surugensis]|uniref:Alpha/beta hydrolase n=1 Tax=Shewanella surugensis TaxID=212020 RepID=A0ABT0LF15_9GAMM|nr:alpha/beta hydrolase [Shewanella surugensis]MCL1126296.1 alpha/beta hydrolase [Shewanella surugensis]
MDSVLESGIDQIVRSFIAEKDELTPLPSIEQRRQRYIDSTALAGESYDVYQVFEIECDGISLKIFKPSKDTGLPVVIYFHGGCFVSGDFQTHDQQLRQIAHLSGAVVIAVKYRLAPEHIYPSAHDDAFRACELIYRDCFQWGGDKECITLAGDSAGGHIALVISLRLRDQAIWLPIKQILIYPMLDATATSSSMSQYGEDYVITKEMLMSGFKHYIGQNTISLMHPEISPLFRDDWEGLPETHILTAEFDPLRDEGESLYRALRCAGVEAHCRRYLGVIHGFIQLSMISQSAREALEHVALLIKPSGKIIEENEQKVVKQK